MKPTNFAMLGPAGQVLAGNAQLAALLREIADRIDGEDRAEIVVGVALCHADGSVATSYDGACYSTLLGAVGVLRARLEQHFLEV